MKTVKLLVLFGFCYSLNGAVEPKTSILVSQNKAVASSADHINLDWAVDYAVQNNVNFKSAYTNMEVAAAATDAFRASLFEPAMQFSYNKGQTQSPSQGFAPSYSSLREGGSVEYVQTMKDSSLLTLGYDTNTFSSTGGIATKAAQNQSGARLNLSRTLGRKGERFLSSELNINLATEDQKIAYHNYLHSYQDLVFRVTDSYLNTVKDFKQIEVSESVLKYRRELLDLTKVKFDLGVVTKLDVLRVEVQVAQQEENIIATSNQYENSRDTLLNILNYKGKKDLALDYTAQDQVQEYNEAEYLTKALEFRQDLQSARLNLQKENLRFEQSRKVLKNRVELTASVKEHSTDQNFTSSQDFDNRDWTLGLSYDLPLGNESKEKNLKIQQLRIQNQKRSIEDLQNSIELEVRNSIRNIEATYKRLKVLQKSLEQSQENLKLAQLSFEKGIKSSIDVLDAQDDLLEVNTNYVNSFLDLKIAQFRLLKSCGLIEVPEKIQTEAERYGLKQISKN